MDVSRSIPSSHTTSQHTARGGKRHDALWEELALAGNFAAPTMSIIKERDRLSKPIFGPDRVLDMTPLWLRGDAHPCAHPSHYHSRERSFLQRVCIFSAFCMWLFNENDEPVVDCLHYCTGHHSPLTLLVPVLAAQL